MKNKILYIPALFLFMFACVSEPDFSNVPSIGFNKIQLLTTETQGLLGISKKDSVIMTVDFQDGDGDLGFTTEELAKLKKTTGDSLQTFIVNIWVSKNGKFVKSNPKEKFGGNIPIRFKQGSKPGPIEGTIDYSATFEYNVFQGIPLLTGKKDTVKFEIQIKDRALNASNIVQTTPIVIYSK
ncbi:hypothetical protein [Arcicella aurantiaca]|nr:hypothetical protein [Arcicella aurantiaca]